MSYQTFATHLENVRTAEIDSLEYNAALEEIQDNTSLVLSEEDCVVIDSLAQNGRAGGVFVAAIARGDVSGGRVAAIVLSRWAMDQGGDGELSSRLPTHEASGMVNGLIALGDDPKEAVALGILEQLESRDDPAAKWALKTLLFCYSYSEAGRKAVQAARTRLALGAT